MSGKSIKSMRPQIPSRRGPALLFLAAALCLAAPSCQTIKSRLGFKTRAEVLQESYAINVLVYETSVDVKAGVEEIADYFLKDLSWVEGVSSALELDLPEAEAQKDMSREGEVLNFNIRILGINFPCRMINLKFDPEKDLWLMIISRGTWMMWRIDSEPIPDGNRLKVSILGQPGKALGPLADSLRVVEAGSKQFELILATVQAEFDPAIDPKEATKGGMRGELYTTFFQGYESSIWINADPGQVREWIFAEPKRLEGLIPMVELQGQCIENPGVLLSPQRLGYCPALFRTGKGSLPASVLGRGVEAGEPELGSSDHEIWVVILDILLRVEVSILPQAGGSRLKVVASSELPGVKTPEAIDLIAGISKTPENAEAVLLQAKKDLEKSRAAH